MCLAASTPAFSFGLGIGVRYRTASKRSSNPRSMPWPRPTEIYLEGPESQTRTVGLAAWLTKKQHLVLGGTGIYEACRRQPSTIASYGSAHTQVRCMDPHTGVVFSTAGTGKQQLPKQGRRALRRGLRERSK